MGVIANIFSRAKAFWNRPAQPMHIQNRYEAAQPVSLQRSYVPAFVRDARYDANSFTRWELARKIRYFRRNSWLLQRIQDEFTKWTVGPAGLQIIPASSDEKWNEAMLADYLQWCESPSLDSTLTMGQIHHQIAGESQIDGELFINLTRRKPMGQPSMPAIQLIESHRCSTPGMEYSTREDSDIVDGVQLAVEFGRATKPIGYWVRDGFMGTEWTFRGTEEMIHVFDPERVGMYRGITPFASTLVTLHDLDDMEIMEMERAKQNSEIANVLTNPSGEMDPVKLMRERLRGNASPQPTPGTPDDELNKRIEMYRRILGARTIALRTGETLQQYNNNIPSAATQWYWRYKIGQICSASGIPMILIFPELIESAQGTVVRGIYDNAHEFFRRKFFIFAHAARRIYRFYAQWARYNRPDLVDAPSDWDKCHVIPPRAVNVDRGRDSVATLAEWESGMTNLSDIAGRIGTTSAVLLRKKAMDVATCKKIAAEVSAETGQEVKAEEIMGNLAEIVSKLSNSEPDDDDEPKKKPRKEEELVEA